MPNVANVPGRGRGRLLFPVLPLLLLLAALLPMQAMAQAPVYCPAANVTATVAHGGSVSLDVSACDGPFNIGVGDPGNGTTPNGSYVVGPQTGPSGTQSVTYSHGGNGATSDTFKLEDQDGGLFDVNITITPAGSSIVVSPASLPAMTTGTAINVALSSTGGTGPYVYTFSGPPLPGLALSSGGQLTGAPTQRGPYSFSVQSTDSLGAFATRSYNGTVGNPNLAPSPASATAIQNVPFSLALAVNGGTPPLGFALAPGSNPFPAGISMSATGVISGTTANVGTYNVTLRITDGSTGPGAHFEDEPFTLTVSPPPSVSITVAPASVSEDGGTNLAFTVTRSLNLTSATVVNITTTGTATSGTDYTGGVATVSIPAGATTATVTIDPTVDGTVEADETVILTIAAGTGYTVGAPASATGTILNDDVPSVSIGVAPGSVSEDGGANLVYTVTLSQAALSNTSVGFTIGGTATNGTDYGTIASPLVITAGATTGTITVDPTADGTIEADETVVLTLAAGAGYTVGTPSAATGTILNDDLPNLVINDVAANEGNAGTTNFTFIVSLSAPAGPGGVTFDIATTNGTAIAGVDYVANSLTGQTIPAGSTAYSFTVLVNGDALNEPNETFFVNVTNVTGAVVVDGQGVGTITNDDAQPSLSINDTTVVEGNSGTVVATFTVTLSAASGQTVAVNYATADGTATTADADYASASGTLTFAPGVTTQTINVTVNGDIVPEATETFFVNLSGATNATIADNQGVGTITNDDVPVTISPAAGALPGATVAAPYTQTLTASGGVAPYTFTITAGALPAGLDLDPTGTISGTPTAGGTFNFTITATDSSPSPGPFSGSAPYSVQVNAPTITLPATTLADAILGSAYAATINAASGGTAPYTYAVTSGALPGGLTLVGTTISGTPTAIGAFSFEITATDSSTGVGPYTSAPTSYSLEVLDAVPVANDVSVSVPFNATNEPIALNITEGTPDSVTVVSPPTHGTTTIAGATISYTPTAGYSGPDSFTYTATNGTGTSPTPATVTITVGGPAITVTPSDALTAQVGVAYANTFTFAGGTAPYTDFLVTGLPAGVIVTGNTATGVSIAGTPTAAGTFSVDVTGTDSSTGEGPFTESGNFVITVDGPTLVLTPAPGTIAVPYGITYTETFVATGGTAPYTYAVTLGTLPPGLVLAADGTLSGTATTPGSYAGVRIMATDSTTGTGAPFMVAEDYTFTVAAPTIAIDPPTLPDGTAGTAYTATLTASGGVAPYTYAVSSGALPPGVTLAGDGTLSGTPTASGTFNVEVAATDDNDQVGARGYLIVIAADTLAIAPTTLPDGVAGAPYDATVAASGGIAPYTYALTGTLPDGVTFANGVFAGTPTEAGSFNVSVQATDSTGGTPATVTQPYTLVIQEPVISIDPATLPNGIGGVAYSATLTGFGGAAPYTFAVTAGSLPTGLALSPAGVLSGTPTADGDYTFTVTATDDNGFTGERAYTVSVGEPTITLIPATLPAGVVGEAYTVSLGASGGTAPYTFALTTGTLPTGVTLAADGTLAGTPTVGGSFAITVTATDDNGFTGSQAYTLVIGAPTITIAPATLPTATANGAYSQSLTATGGTAPYTYAVTTGTLPAGLTLSPAGVLSGTPTSAGAASFTVTATDDNDQTGTQAYTLEVLGPVTLPATTLADATAGEAYAATLNPATGGTGPYTYAVTAGALPAGITLSATGALSGTPTVVGDAAFTVTATDANGNTATRDYTLAVVGQEQVITFPEQTVTEREFEEGATFELSPLATGGASGNPVTYTAGPASVCTISGTTVTMVGPGTCVITASQDGGGMYADAEPQTQSIVLLGGTVVVPQPAVIPTLSQYVLLLLALMLAGIGALWRRND